MGWRDLLQTADETQIVSPWVGGRSLRVEERTWTVEGRLPPEHGWVKFHPNNRKATWVGVADPAPDTLRYPVCGYLVGDRLVPDDVRVQVAVAQKPDPTNITDFSETVHLIEPGLDRFVRITAGRCFEDGFLVYQSMDMPQGPEEEVLKAYQDRAPDVSRIKGVPPALDAAFRMESWRRTEAERLRAEAERRRQEEEERLRREEMRQQLIRQTGSAEARRALARVDFAAAARAALAQSNAEYLDHRPAYGRNEMVVTFRLNQRRFECTCDKNTLQIIEAGICLTDHHTGRRDDALLTLESLPPVILEAIRMGKLVVFRHADGEHGDDDDAGDEDDY